VAAGAGVGQNHQKARLGVTRSSRRYGAFVPHRI
jgi:hypothetical protein